MSFQTGQTVGGYEFLDVLGSSNVDVAYQVRNHLSQRLETLKVLYANGSQDRESVERFLREIKVHARLLHPNIATFYTASELDGQLIMTTEFVEGITLTERLRVMGPLPWCEAVSHISQVLLALGYAHEQGIVHRNVTTDTILLTADTTVKLTGFGLAKSLASPNLTQVGAVLGTLKYIPPEQIRGGSVDARGDLYSVGVVLYEALTGRLPFDSHNQFQMMLDQVHTEPAPPSTVNPRVPPEFDSILLTALAKDPAARFQSADQFHARLEAVKHSLRAKASLTGRRNIPDQEAQISEWEPSASAGPAPTEPADLQASYPVPETDSLVPSFCAVTSTDIGHRNLLIWGVSSLVIGMAVAAVLAMVRL